MNIDKLKAMLKSKRKNISELTDEEIQKRIKKVKRLTVIGMLGVGLICSMLILLGVSMFNTIGSITADKAAMVTKQVIVKVLFMEAGFTLVNFGMAAYTFFAVFMMDNSEELMLKTEVHIRQAIKEATAGRRLKEAKQ